MEINSVENLDSSIRITFPAFLSYQIDLWSTYGYFQSADGFS